MKHYSITIHAGEAIEKAVNQDVRATFDIHAISESAAQHRAMKMMGYIVEGYIEDKNLNPAIADDGCIIVECKEIA